MKGKAGKWLITTGLTHTRRWWPAETDKSTERPITKMLTLPSALFGEKTRQVADWSAERLP